MSQRARWMKVLDVAATLSIIVAGSAVTWSVVKTTNRPTLNRANTSTPTGMVEDVTGKKLTVAIGEGAARMPSAKIALVEFTDFECPFCARYASETLPQIRSEFIESGRIAYAFKNFPLEALHPNARKAAVVAACARREGKFWEMHEWLFTNQGSLSFDSLKSKALTLSIDERCIEESDSEVAREIAEGRKLMVNSTPTFFLGDVRSDGLVTLRRKINGAVPYDVFKEEITGLLGTASRAPIGDVAVR